MLLLRHSNNIKNYHWLSVCWNICIKNVPWGWQRWLIHLYSVIRLKIQAYLCKKCCKQEYSKEALSWYNFNPKGIIIFSYDEKHSNCSDFAGTFPVFSMLSRCHEFNQSVPVFRLLTKKKFIFTYFFIGSLKLTQINIFWLFDSIFYSNSYLECYKKYNSFELNENVILKRFDSNVPVLFLETYIRFDYKQWGTCSELFFRTVFFENIKIESNYGFLKCNIIVYQR